MHQLVTRLQAALDVEEAASWYESRRPGLGLRFLDELDYVLKRVAAAPFQFPVIHPEVRRALLNRFPYSVYFWPVTRRSKSSRFSINTAIRTHGGAASEGAIVEQQ